MRRVARPGDYGYYDPEAEQAEHDAANGYESVDLLGEPPSANGNGRGRYIRPAASPPCRTSWTADELLAETFPEPRWAVPGVLAEGLNLLAGAPKVGKSWFALDIAVAVASGGKALGGIDVDQGEVLYLALEDTPRRMADRLRKVLVGNPAPSALTVAVECAALPRGGSDRIRQWADAHPGRRLVAVDVFTKVRGRSDPRVDRYEADYDAASCLKAIADEYGVAVLLLHHTRKAAADDFLDSVSGTQGLAGAADCVLVLTRARNTKQAVLKLTGRDVEEAQYALELDAALGAWQMLDIPAAEIDLSETRAAIVRLVRDNGPMTPKAIAEALDLKHDTVRQTVRRMADDDQLATDGNGNYYDPLSPVTPVTQSLGESDSGSSPVTPTTRGNDTSDRCDTPSRNTTPGMPAPVKDENGRSYYSAASLRHSEQTKARARAKREAKEAAERQKLTEHLAYVEEHERARRRSLEGCDE